MAQVLAASLTSDVKLGVTSLEGLNASQDFISQRIRLELFKEIAPLEGTPAMIVAGVIVPNST